MDPNVEDAENKLDQAQQIEQNAADLRSEGNSDSATTLETEAASLRSEGEQEKADAEYQAEQEKREVDEKYGTA